MLNPHGLVVWKRLPILGHWETGRWFAWRDDWRWGCTTAMGEGDDYGKVSHGSGPEEVFLHALLGGYHYTSRSCRCTFSAGFVEKHEEAGEAAGCPIVRPGQKGR